MIALVMANLKTITISILVVIALLGVSLGISAIRRMGMQAKQHEIDRQNDEARNAALEGIRNVDGCYAAGGVWSVAGAKCQRP